jgi:AcrR family transcriptional regulator
VASIAEISRRAGRPSLEEAEKIRKAILDAAQTLFLSLGYAEATIDGIALLAQTTRRSVVHRFPAKEDLLVAAVERKIAEMLEVMIVPEPESDEDLLDALRGAFQRLLNKVLEPRTLGYLRLMMNEVVRFPQIGEMIIAWNEALVASYVRLILRAQDAGYFRRFNAKTIAHMGIGVMLSNPANRGIFGDETFHSEHSIDLYFSEMWAVFLTMA